MGAIRWFLLAEALSFFAASSVHAGAFVAGYEHAKARIAEAVIGTVLLIGLVATLVDPRWTRRAGTLAQGFALLGTFLGLVTIAVGVGPRTVPDLVYHAGMILVLAAGLRVALRHAERSA